MDSEVEDPDFAKYIGRSWSLSLFWDEYGVPFIKANPSSMTREEQEEDGDVHLIFLKQGIHVGDDDDDDSSPKLGDWYFVRDATVDRYFRLSWYIGYSTHRPSYHYFSLLAPSELLSMLHRNEELSFVRHVVVYELGHAVRLSGYPPCADEGILEEIYDRLKSRCPLP